MKCFIPGMYKGYNMAANNLYNNNIHIYIYIIHSYTRNRQIRSIKQDYKHITIQTNIKIIIA